MNLEHALAEIAAKLAARTEWLLIQDSGKSFALQNSEIEISFEREKIFCGFVDEKGFQIRRIVEYKIENENLILEVARDFGRTREKIKFVPRISAAQLNADIERARLENANRIAALIVAENSRTKLLRVALNKENGRLAEIVFETFPKKTIAAFADVSDSLMPENLVTHSILWLTKSKARRKNPVGEVWLLTDKKLYSKVRKLHALLNEGWKSKISVVEMSPSDSQAPNKQIKSRANLTIKDLWREKPPKIVLPESMNLSLAANAIVEVAPEKIDVVLNKHGETVRFFGLPFARVRKIGAAEQIWFGVERDKRILNEETQPEFNDLLRNLETYRRFDSPNKRHELFRLAPEAWLEAVLRRNVNLLDRNLILSPIHQQFRAGGEKIDLLALRKDGRLIVIELKVEPDRELIFQALDYWRKIESQRRGGNLQRAKIFGDAKISDAPTLVYLVAPTLSFHHDFKLLSKTVAPEIPVYKFNLNENWRETLKVLLVEKIEN